MNIVFFCQSCGSRFEVPPTSAGKKGRCRGCGQMMTVPRAQELASMAAMPALAPAAVGAGPRAAASEVKAGKSLSWLAAASSNVGLAALTVDKMRIGGARSPVKAKYDLDMGDSKPYLLGAPVRLDQGHTSGRGAASGIKNLWSRQLGGVQSLFRKLNEAAYLISVPFLILIIVGASVGSRPLALLGGTAVVLLNLGRIIAGVANLAIMPFREGPLQGILFLIPPFTFFYLASHWKKVKKPTQRIGVPIATIAAVFLAFAFVPTLRSDGKMVSVKDLKNELRRDAQSLGKEMVGEVKKAKTIDVQDLGTKAQKAIGSAAGQINSIGQPVEAGKAP